MIKVLLDQYYRCRPGLPPSYIILFIQQNAGQTDFGTEKTEMGLGDCAGTEGGMYPLLPHGYFIFGSDVTLEM